MRSFFAGLAIVAGCAPPQAPELAPKPPGIPPAEALARMKLAPGFTAVLFASEPDVRQPVAMSWDGRGRLWVVEYLQYPHPAGLRAVEWDNYFRTKYDRVPEPPPRGPRGADRIKIFEDADGDGKADRVKVFVDGLNLATGVVVGHGGVFVAQAPYLLFYPDRDADDRPDGPPDVCLEGFGMEDTHSLVNSLAWGPDGWLYGATGSTSTQKIRGHTFQQAVWRYHPRTKEFEVFAEGGQNMWSFDWDDEGQLFNGTNWNAITFHMVQGGYYLKSFEKHGPLSNPYAFGYFSHVEHRAPYKGGGITVGGLIYQGGAFPDRFRGTLITPDVLHNSIAWFDLDRQGSTFRAKHAGDLLTAGDPCFRPIAMKTGPDGALYVADWYDLRITHNNTREDTWDKSSGRIYRIAPAGLRATLAPNLAARSSDDLVSFLGHPNEWFHREARRILAERRDASVLPKLRDAVAKNSGHAALECLWALYVSGGFDDALAIGLLAHGTRAVRAWTARLLGDARQVSPAALEALRVLASKEPEPAVRSQLASTARRLPASQALPLLFELIRRDEDADDRHIPLLLWWAIERHVAAHREECVTLLTRGSRLARTHLAGRLARRLASAGSPEDFAACARLLESVGAAEAVQEGLELGLAARRPGAAAAPLREALARLCSGTRAVRLAARLGDETARKSLVALALDTSAKSEDRIAALTLLEDPRALLELLARRESEPVLTEVIKALGRFDDPAVADAILARIGTLGPAVRERALDTLAGRKEAAAKMIAHLGPRFRSEPLALVQKVLQHDDPGLTALVEKFWGRVQASNKTERARTLAGIVGPVANIDKPGRTVDRARGRELFVKRCATCHQLFGEGAKVGPDLTPVDRRSIEVLMLNVVDPSASIRTEYTSFVVRMKDGRVLGGFVVDPTPETLTLVDLKGERTVLARAEMEGLRESPLSPMPEGLLDDLDPESLVNLFAYLTSKGP